MSSSYVPGPGSYKTGKYDKQSWLNGQGKYTMGKSARDFNTKNKVPGPGAYGKSNIFD